MPRSLVHRPFDVAAIEPRPLLSLDDDAVAATWEGAMRAALDALQAAYRDGAKRIVLVLPTIGLSGAEGMALEAAVSEGLRALAKSAAKQWGADGVTVNCVLVRVLAAGQLSLAPPALDHLDVDAVVSLLIDDRARSITASTIVADGGVWTAL